MNPWLEWGIGILVTGLIGRWALHVEQHIDDAHDRFERVAKLETKLQDHLAWCHGQKDDER